MVTITSVAEQKIKELMAEEKISSDCECMSAAVGAMVTNTGWPLNPKWPRRYDHPKRVM